MLLVEEPGTRREQKRTHREYLRNLDRQMAEIEREERERGFGKYGDSRGRRARRGLMRAAATAVPPVLVLGGAAGLLWAANPTIGGGTVRDRIGDLLAGEPDGEYAFILETRGSGAVGWDPCQPIRFVVNPAGAPTDWERVVSEAVNMTADASGFEFEFVGTSEARPLEDATGSRGAPLLISWAGPDEVPDLDGTVVGVAYTHPLLKGERSYFVSGVVALDRGAYAAMDDDRQPVFVLAHELGHILGLDHVDDPTELMNEEFVGQDGFGPGDLAGLREVHDVPCA